MIIGTRRLPVQSMDSSHVALVSLIVREECIFNKTICGANNQLKFKYLNGANTANFQCETSEDDKVAEFDLNLMWIESGRGNS